VKVVVTGAAGFIGSSTTDALLAAGHAVVGIDNFSTGSERFLEQAMAEPGFELVTLDLLEHGGALVELFEGADAVIHLAANADVRFGWNTPDRDLKQNIVVTHNVLEGARVARVRACCSRRTGSVYGRQPSSRRPRTAPSPFRHRSTAHQSWRVRA